MRETDKIIEKIEEIANHKEDSTRMFQVVKQLQIKDKDEILVNSEEGVTASEKKRKKPLPTISERSSGRRVMWKK